MNSLSASLPHQLSHLECVCLLRTAPNMFSSDSVSASCFSMHFRQCFSIELGAETVDGLAPFLYTLWNLNLTVRGFRAQKMNEHGGLFANFGSSLTNLLIIQGVYSTRLLLFGLELMLVIVLTSCSFGSAESVLPLQPTFGHQCLPIGEVNSSQSPRGFFEIAKASS